MLNQFFHDGIRATVLENVELSPSFDVADGTKQCVPTDSCSYNFHPRHAMHRRDICCRIVSVSHDPALCLNGSTYRRNSFIA